MTRRRSRNPLPGYPVEEPFRSREAIEDYLSDDRIICLLCGRPFKALTSHLGVIHGVTGDEYKDKYNIPYSYGLARETTRKLHSQKMQERLKDPKELERLRNLVNEVAGARKEGFKKRRPRRDFIIAEHTQRGIRLAGHETQFSNDAKAAFLAALDSGKTQAEALESIGYSKSGFYAVLRKDKAFKAAIDAAIEAQPFALQARQQRLGKRFIAECKRLFLKGYSDHAIAEKLGVTAMSVNRHTKKMRRDS